MRVSPWVRNERSPLAGVTSTSYGEDVLVLADARAHGAGEAILGSTRGRLCEDTGTTVFIETDDALLALPLSTGALAGVTRALVLEWGGEAGLPVRESDLVLDVIRTTKHPALTSSTWGIVPIVAVEDREVEPWPLTEELAEMFRRRRTALLDL